MSCGTIQDAEQPPFTCLPRQVVGARAVQLSEGERETVSLRESDGEHERVRERSEERETCRERLKPRQVVERRGERAATTMCLLPPFWLKTPFTESRGSEPHFTLREG